MLADVTDTAVKLSTQQFGAFAVALLISWAAIGWLLWLRRQERSDQHDTREEFEAREIKLTADIEAGNARERALYAQLLTMTGDLAPMLAAVQSALKESTSAVAAAQHAIDRMDPR